MTPDERDAILTLSILAAFSDGRNDEREREELKRIAASLSPESLATSPPSTRTFSSGVAP